MIAKKLKSLAERVERLEEILTQIEAHTHTDDAALGKAFNDLSAHRARLKEAAGVPEGDRLPPRLPAHLRRRAQ